MAAVVVVATALRVLAGQIEPIETCYQEFFAKERLILFLETIIESF